MRHVRVLTSAFFNICVSTDPPTGSSPKPWFITETTFTSDGHRTRVCAGRFAYRHEAEADVERRCNVLADEAFKAATKMILRDWPAEGPELQPNDPNDPLDTTSALGQN